MRVNVKFFLTFLSWFVFCLLLLISTPDQPRSLRERKKIFHLSTQYLCPDIILACLLAKSLQSCLTLCDPIDGSPQAPPSLGFSRQEHWSGLPFPSPMHESEKWKSSRSVMSDSQRPHGLQPTRLLCPWDFPGKSTGVGCHCLLTCLKRSFGSTAHF